MSLRKSLRVEDVLTICVVVAFLFAGASIPKVDEARRGELCFIGFPATLIILGLSIRYAVGRTAGDRLLVSSIGRVIRDWLPFALFLAFYETAQSKLLASIRVTEIDANLLQIDRTLFGETPSVAMQSWISVPLTEFLSLCYFLHLLWPPLVAFFWYRRDTFIFRRFLLSVFLCGAIGSTLYVAMPAVGPAMAYPSLYSTSLKGTVGVQAVAMMNWIKAPRDVFPSLHIAISAIALYFSARHSRALFLLIFPFVLGNWISTLYLRYHYMIDVVAGFLFAVLMVALAQVLLALEHRWTSAPDVRAEIRPDSR